MPISRGTCFTGCACLNASDSSRRIPQGQLTRVFGDRVQLKVAERKVERALPRAFRLRKKASVRSGDSGPTHPLHQRFHVSLGHFNRTPAMGQSRRGWESHRLIGLKIISWERAA